MHGDVQYTLQTHALGFGLILEALICRRVHIFSEFLPGEAELHANYLKQFIHATNP